MSLDLPAQERNVCNWYLGWLMNDEKKLNSPSWRMRSRASA